jgi:hypothetical protein
MKKPASRLQLNRETLRRMSTIEAGGARGGANGSPTTVEPTLVTCQIKQCVTVTTNTLTGPTGPHLDSAGC